MDLDAATDFSRTGPDWERIRFSTCVTVYAAALGAVAIIVNSLAQTDALDVPRHMPLGGSLVIGGAGALAASAATWPAAHWLYGRTPAFDKEKSRTSHGLPVWILLGFGFGVVYSLLMGGYFLRTATGLLSFADGTISVTDLVFKYSEIVFGMPVFGPALGIRLLYTSIVAGLLFGPGAWAISRFNKSADPATARYWPCVIALTLAAIVIAVVVFVPPTALARLG